MHTCFAKLAVTLCMIVQIWIGCARGPGMFVCVHTSFDGTTARAEAERVSNASDVWDASESCSSKHCCDHHRPIESPAPEQPREQDHDCPSCIDLPLPGAAVLAARESATDGLSHALDVALIALPGLLETARVLPAQRCPPWKLGDVHAPDAQGLRCACGISTTRLLV